MFLKQCGFHLKIFGHQKGGAFDENEIGLLIDWNGVFCSLKLFVIGKNMVPKLPMKIKLLNQKTAFTVEKKLNSFSFAL